MPRCRLLRAAKRCLLRKKVPEISHLDECLLRKTYQHRSLVDRVCLSLSCKKFLNLFGTIVKHEELMFPGLSYTKLPIVTENSRQVPRTELLLRLEDRHWAYCARCLRLHRRRGFIRPSLRHPPLQRFCVQYAGIDDLCYRVLLTLRDRARLIQLFKSPVWPIKDENFPFRVLIDQKGKPCLQHDCYIATDNGCETRFHTTLQLAEANQLMARTQYRTFFSPSLARLTQMPVYLCAHENLLTFIRSDLVLKACCYCGTEMEKRPTLGE